MFVMGKIYYSHFDSDSLENIITGLKGKNEYKCVIPYHNSTSEDLISKTVFTLLQESGYENYHQVFSIIVNELITHVNKMNIKRDFFVENNLDANNNEECLEGTEKFNSSNYYKNYMSNILEKDKTHYIKISIETTKQSLKISIINGYELNSYELHDFKTSISYADKFSNLNEVVKENKNISESHNFGLILAVLMLKNINIKSEAITITSFDGFTETELNIPFMQISDVNAEKVTKEIIKEIKMLPQFPDSVLRLQKELMDPEWDYDRISDYILSDSALTAEILRLVNSPVYRVNDKIDKVSIAVKKIGITGLKAILYNFGSLEVLGNAYHIDKINRYKEHLFQVALISSYIANHRKLNTFAEDIYVAALMHDIGKIIVNSLNQELSDAINWLCHDRMLPTDVIDNLSDGYNHSIIGAKLSEKWNFPEKYSHAILYHHSPMMASSEFKIITYCVYLGNEISQIINKKRRYSSLNRSVLKFFNLETEDKFNSLISSMKNEGLFI